MKLTQKSIHVTRTRSEYTGDKSSNRRIKQVIVCNKGITYEVWSNPDNPSESVVHQLEEGVVRSVRFEKGKYAFDIREVRIRRITGKEIRDIEYLHYAEPDIAGRKHVRNSLVMGDEPMVNDSERKVTCEEINKRFLPQVMVVRFAEAERVKDPTARIVFEEMLPTRRFSKRGADRSEPVGAER